LSEQKKEGKCRWGLHLEKKKKATQNAWPAVYGTSDTEESGKSSFDKGKKKKLPQHGAKGGVRQKQFSTTSGSTRNKTIIST